MDNATLEIRTDPHRSGLRLRSLVVPRVRPVDIAREAGVSRQFVYAVLDGKAPPSPRIIAACERLGLPPRLWLEDRSS